MGAVTADSVDEDERNAKIVALARKGYPTQLIASMLSLSMSTVRRVRAAFGVAATKPAGPTPVGYSSTCPKCGGRVAAAKVGDRVVLVDIEVRQVVTFRRGSDVGERVEARSLHGETCVRVQLAADRARETARRRG